MQVNGSTTANGSFTALYEELRRAAYKLKKADGSITLNPTALVHEAYLKIAASPEFAAESRAHLKHTAIRAMRQLLIDAARRRQSAQRGSGRRPESIEDQVLSVPSIATSLDEIVRIDMALQKLHQEDPKRAQIMEDLLFFGLSQQEMAERAGLSERTVRREIRLGKAWLKKELLGSEESDARRKSQAG